MKPALLTCVCAPGTGCRKPSPHGTRPSLTQHWLSATYLVADEGQERPAKHQRSERRHLSVSLRRLPRLSRHSLQQRQPPLLHGFVTGPSCPAVPCVTRTLPLPRPLSRHCTRRTLQQTQRARSTGQHRRQRRGTRTAAVPRDDIGAGDARRPGEAGRSDRSA